MAVGSDLQLFLYASQSKRYSIMVYPRFLQNSDSDSLLDTYSFSPHDTGEASELMLHDSAQRQTSHLQALCSIGRCSQPAFPSRLNTSSFHTPNILKTVRSHPRTSGSSSSLNMESGSETPYHSIDILLDGILLLLSDFMPNFHFSPTFPSTPTRIRGPMGRLGQGMLAQSLDASIFSFMALSLRGSMLHDSRDTNLRIYPAPYHPRSLVQHSRMSSSTECH